MRIDKVEIEGFGKLNSVSLSFGAGFNLIVGDNESGKSTLCEFLLAMFYEVPNEGKRLSLGETVRKKYRPWNTEQFGGKVYFTDDDGRQYVLEKKIGATKRSDRARLLYADTWDEAGDAENVGERFFNLGREGFLRTFYIQSLGAEIEDGTEILSRLSNMETSGTEDISYSNIQSALMRNQLAILSKTGKGGKLAAQREVKKKLDEEKLLYQHHRTKLAAQESEQTLLFSRTEQLKKEINIAENAFSIAKEHEAYLAYEKELQARGVLEKQYTAAQERLEMIKDESSTQTILPEEIEKAQKLENKLLILNSKQAEFEQKREQFKQEHISHAAKQKRKGIFASVLTFVVSILLSIIFLRTSFIFSAGVALLGIILAVLLFVLFSREDKQDAFSLQNPAIEREETERELCDLLAAYGTESVASLMKRAAETEQRQMTRKELEEQILSLEKSLTEIRNPKEQEFTEEAKFYRGETAEELQTKIFRLRQEQEQCKEQYYGLSVELAKYTAEERSMSDIESDILAVTSKIAELEAQNEAYVRAGEWLDKAHREIKQNFAPRLNKKTAEIFSKLTGGKYKNVRVGDGFRLNYENENGEIVEADYLSSGTYDLLYIALRFATVSVLSGSSTPPLILDDAFLQFDDGRAALAADYLIEQSKLGQILSFTCHRELAKQYNGKQITKIDLNMEGVFQDELQN